ncbi:DUF1993 domain-containing protein [Oxalobacteraceae bacterium OM1]|nr:DUF1993 domain-containing protein [Oxalobacteraceae bacterium OM1]
MTISMYAASIPALKQGLAALDKILTKAETHATEKKIDPNALLQARLFPDMFALARQVQLTSDFAKGIAARLAGVENPSYADTETTFVELHERIAKTLAFIDTVPAAKIDGSEGREIVLMPGTPRERKLDGQSYLVNYALPQFYFHLTTAYALLRHNGIEIGKRDFLNAA